MSLKKIQVFTFLMTISTAFALTCYSCDTSHNRLCNYGIGRLTFGTVNCNEEFGGGVLADLIPKNCVTFVAKDKDGNKYVARGCMPNVGQACKAAAKTLSIFTTWNEDIEAIDIDCFPCDGDKCNSAIKFSGCTLLGVVLAAIAFLF